VNLHALAAVSVLYHHHEENEASYTGFLVLNVDSLSD